MGVIVSINISRKKGQVKTPVAEVEVIAAEGIRDDAHRGFGHRQVSLLMLESIALQRARLGLEDGREGDERGGERAKERNEPAAAVEKGAARRRNPPATMIGPGAYAENFTTRGLDLGRVAIGDELVIGGGPVRLRITQIGKECHTRCAVARLTGDCIMPELGIFCEVLAGGIVRTGDPIEKR